MTYESQLKKLKEEIVSQAATSGETEQDMLKVMLKEKLEEYDKVSVKYQALFKNILPDLTKMTQEYQYVKKRRKSKDFPDRHYLLL